jgi:hypothetical protein
MGQLNLRVVIQAVDRITAPVREISRAVGPGLAQSAKIGGLAVRDLMGDLRRLATVGLAAGTAAAFGLYRMVRATADAGDEAVKTSQKVGVGVVAWQRYAYAAQLADVESGELADGLKFLNQSAAMAAAGATGDAKAFAALGISIRDQNGALKPTGALFEEVAARFTTMEDGAQKTTLAMTLFGRAGANLIPLLNSGADDIRRLGDEAERLGIVVPEEQARAAEVFNDSITTLMASVRGLGMGVAGGLIPQLTELIKKTTAWIAANKPEVLARVRTVIEQISAALPGVLQGLGDFAKLMGDVARIVGPIVGAIGGLGTVLDVMAGVLIGRVAIALWMATKAVLGLNAAMWANPIGLIIAGLAALVFAGWLLYRNWNKVVAGVTGAWTGFVRFFERLGGQMAGAFKRAVDALWRLLPPWLRMIFRGAAFTLRVVGQGLNGGGPSGGGGTGRPPAPRPAVGTQQSRVGGSVDVRIGSDGRPRVQSVRSTNPAVPITASTYRGSTGD